MSGIRLLVTGNRVALGEAWELTIARWLHAVSASAKRKRVGVTLIHGAAKGADSIAAEVAERLGWEIEAYPADWDAHGDKAGPLRNELMSHQSPSRALAFGLLSRPDNRDTGTGHMVKLLNRNGVLVTVVSRAGVLP